MSTDAPENAMAHVVLCAYAKRLAKEIELPVLTADSMAALESLAEHSFNSPDANAILKSALDEPVHQHVLRDLLEFHTEPHLGISESLANLIPLTTIALILLSVHAELKFNNGKWTFFIRKPTASAVFLRTLAQILITQSPYQHPNDKSSSGSGTS